MSNNLRSRNKSLPTTGTMVRLADKLGTCTGYDLLFSIEGGKVYFRHNGHPTLSTRPYVVFSICPTYDVFYEAMGTHRGFFSREELKDMEAYLRERLVSK